VVIGSALLPAILFEYLFSAFLIAFEVVRFFIFSPASAEVWEVTRYEAAYNKASRRAPLFWVLTKPDVNSRWTATVRDSKWGVLDENTCII
jgi:hypothetical protein